MRTKNQHFLNIFKACSLNFSETLPMKGSDSFVSTRKVLTLPRTEWRGHFLAQNQCLNLFFQSHSLYFSRILRVVNRYLNERKSDCFSILMKVVIIPKQWKWVIFFGPKSTFLYIYLLDFSESVPSCRQ